MGNQDALQFLYPSAYPLNVLHNHVAVPGIACVYQGEVIIHQKIDVRPLGLLDVVNPRRYFHGLLSQALAMPTAI